MKDITTFLKEALYDASLNEGLKDVQVPRKGSYIYILKYGDTKAQKVRIENVIKRPMAKGYDKSFTYVAELADNEYGIKDYYQYRFSGINYSPKAVEAQKIDNDTYYFGIDASSINDFVKADAGKKLEVVLKEISKLEDELAAANEKKAQLEAKINGEITESLLEGKETFVYFTLFGDDTSSLMEKVSNAASSSNIYFEKTGDDSFKLKIKPGQKTEKVESVLNGLIESVPEEKKEEMQDNIDKLNASIEKMKEVATVEENPEEKKEED